MRDYLDLFLEEKLPSEVREVLALGDAVLEIGTWRARHADREREGHVMRLWRQEGGRWKVHREVFNLPHTEEPPRAAAR